MAGAARRGAGLRRAAGDGRRYSERAWPRPQRLRPGAGGVEGRGCRRGLPARAERHGRTGAFVIPRSARAAGGGGPARGPPQPRAGRVGGGWRAGGGGGRARTALFAAVAAACAGRARISHFFSERSLRRGAGAAVTAAARARLRAPARCRRRRPPAPTPPRVAVADFRGTFFHQEALTKWKVNSACPRPSAGRARPSVAGPGLPATCAAAPAAVAAQIQPLGRSQGRGTLEFSVMTLGVGKGKMAGSKGVGWDRAITRHSCILIWKLCRKCSWLDMLAFTDGQD